MDRFVLIRGFADLAQDAYDEAPEYHTLPAVNAWGWLNDDNPDCVEFTPLYAPGLEAAPINEKVTLYDEERNQLVDATPENTPDEAWAALAMFRMGV